MVNALKKPGGSAKEGSSRQTSPLGRVWEALGDLGGSGKVTWGRTLNGFKIPGGSATGESSRESSHLGGRGAEVHTLQQGAQ